MRYASIVANGKSGYHIVGSYFADECERFAASQLQKYIYEATNVLLTYYSDICTKRGLEILIGKNARNAEAYYKREELEALGEEGFLIRRTEDGTLLICGNRSRGTLYGVYAFLERFLGFRAFCTDVEKIDRTDVLELPLLNITETPAFEYRDAYFRGAFNGDLASKLRLNTSVADLSREKGLGMKFYSAHHTFETLLPSAKYFQTNPEYYALINGKRTPTQPCLSNQAVVDIMTQSVLRLIDENPHARVFSVAQNDNQGYCQCERCREIDTREGSPAGSMITFVNRVAERIEQMHPDILIHTFAYQYTRHAPRYVRPRENVIVRLCNIECEWSEPFEVLADKDAGSEAWAFVKDIKDWTAICDRVYIWDYAVNYRHYLLPFPNFYQMAENIRFYKRMGIRGILEEGNFSYGGGAAMDELKSYLIGKLLWNPDLDADVLIDEFLEGVYGKGAPYLKEYITLTTASVKGVRLGIYDDPDSPYFTDDLVATYKKLFQKAIDAAEEQAQKERIEKERLSVEYLEVSRIEDDKARSLAMDALSKKIVRFRLTEIMERRNLYDSFEYVKKSRYAKNREGEYNTYYVVK